jgi:hypothetical protein
MVRRSSGRVLSVLIAVIALVGSLPRVAAQGTPRADQYRHQLIQGITPGHTLRSCVGQARPGGNAALLNVQLSAFNGQVLFLRDLNIPTIGFACVDARFEDLNQPGEIGTGRLQLNVSTTLTLPRGLTPDDFVASVEIYDQATGSTNTGQGLLGFAYLPWP